VVQVSCSFSAKEPQFATSRHRRRTSCPNHCLTLIFEASPRKEQISSYSYSKRFLQMNLSTLWCLSSLACWGVMKAPHLLFLLTEKSRVGERKKETKRLTFHSLSLSHDLKKDGPIHLARKKDRARFLHIHHVKNSSISPHENPHWFHIKDANLYEDPILHDPILHHAEWWPACFWKEPANTAATLQIDS
jgi:hypothetical protein